MKSGVPRARNGPTPFQRRDPPDIREGTHPISGGPLRFLSEATNDATLANWRRIQLMAKERTSVRMQAQIKIMSEQGHSIRSIARVLKLSRRTVRRYLEPAPQWPSENGGLGGEDRLGLCSTGSLRPRNHRQTDRTGGGP